MLWFLSIISFLSIRNYFSIGKEYAIFGVMYHGAEKADDTFFRIMPKARDLGARFKNRGAHPQKRLRAFHAGS